jgi:hypothetical protein
MAEDIRRCSLAGPKPSRRARRHWTLAVAAGPVAMILGSFPTLAGATSPEFTTAGKNIDHVGGSAKVNPGAWVSVGFTIQDHNSSNPASSITLQDTNANIALSCSPNGAVAGTWSVPIPSGPYSLPANYTANGRWFPTNAQQNPSTYQAAAQFPSTFCGSNPAYVIGNGETYSGTMTSNNTADLFKIQFHTAIPSAAGSTNINCSDTAQNPSPGVSACNFGWNGTQDNLTGAGTISGGTSNACKPTMVSNYLPDPVLGPNGSKVLSDESITETPSTGTVAGINSTASTTGSVSSPLPQNTFAAGFADETELYEFLNNNTTGPTPNGSPGAYDATQPVLNSLPSSGPVTHLDGSTTSGGPGLPYAAILSSDLTTVEGVVPTTITSESYTVNPTAWQHGTFPKDPNGQPSDSSCKGVLLGTIQFSAATLNNLTPGQVYAAYLLVRDSDVSGPLANHIWYFTAPAPTPQTASFWVQNIDSCRIAIGGGTFQLSDAGGPIQTQGPLADGSFSQWQAPLDNKPPCPQQGGNCVYTSVGCAQFTLTIPSNGTNMYTLREITPPNNYVACNGGSACKDEWITITIDSAGNIAATMTNVYPDGFTKTFPVSDLISGNPYYSGAQNDPAMFVSQQLGNVSCDGDNDADDMNTGSPSSHCDSDGD